MADNIFDGSTSSDWGVAANWSLGTVPTASDGNVARFDATSPACSLGSSNKVCNGVDFTGYTNTLSFSVRTLSVSGNAVLDPGMTWTGTGVFTMAASGDLTTNGFQSPSTLTFGFTGTAQTYTLQDDLTVLGALSLNGSATSLTINNNGTAKTIYANTNVSSSAPGSQGTAKIVMDGTGTLNNTGAIRNDLEINTAGTITFGTNVRYSTGNFVYTAGTVVTTSSTFTLGVVGATTTTIDAAGITFNAFVFSGGSSAVITLLDDINATGAVSAATTLTVNGFNINIDGSGTYGIGGGGSGLITGTTVVNFIGTSCGWVTGSGANRLAININTAGTLTCSGTTIHGTGALTYIAGTVVTTGHTLTVNATCTLDTDPIVWNTMTFSASMTITLGSDLTHTGAFTSTGGVTMNGNTWHLQGAMTLSGSNVLSGTTTMSFESGGSWIGSSGILRLNTNIAASAGSFTLVGIVLYNTGILTYVSGTLVSTGSTLSIAAATTLNTNGATFDNITIASSIQTLNSLLSASGTMTLNSSSSVTFAGTTGFSVANLVCTTINRTITLKAGVTYTVTTSLLLSGNGPFTTSTNRVNIVSDTASSDTFLTLSSGASCQVDFVAAVDINSSGGRNITNSKGSIVRTTNWSITNPDYFSFF